MMNPIIICIRLLLTLLLCVGVYQEAGKWTALSILLIIVDLEILSVIVVRSK